jgi:AraC-like DNA-binding protein
LGIGEWNIFLRGASFGLALLFFVLMMRLPEQRMRILGGGLTLSVTAYLFVGGGLAVGWSQEIRAGLRMMAVLGPYCFWALSRSMFEDNFRLRAWHILLVAVMLLASVFRTAGEGRFIAGSLEMANPGLLFPSVVLVMHAMWRVLRDYEVDLVEPRRSFRWMFLLAGGCLTLASLVMHWMLRSGYLPFKEAHIFQVSAFLGLKVALAVQVISFIGFVKTGVGGLERAYSEPEAATESDDAFQSERIVSAMRCDGLYLKTGLTIAALAEHLDLPEYRLRRLINRHQGYRNFNDFLNYWRLEESDSAQAKTAILSIALDLGYGSIGPFNRAFKASTGLTPSEFRRSHGGNTAADT